MTSIFSKILYGITLAIVTQQVSALSLAEELAQQDAGVFERGCNAFDSD
ncbi:hypothetical protein [Kangiella koreensis]|uniref:Uncharacterized protein n=1 Tax=Kangiella koreensis (strain DSM 16069 / JCM 12317 / KCTC 12182 / SW-125) TaxID=523791 RepID=C7RBQ8_KANKD|nr:hypothetical protein [Kangiella koreensis]ACV26700.1 hypothetical protein Kkor_1283 [Kangiella koreensis DSM 16069]